MKKNNANFLYIFCMLLTINMFSQEKQYISFIQNEKNVNSIKEKIILDKKPFSIRFFCKPYDSKNEKFYSTQIAVLDNDILFNQIKIGDSSEKYPFFEPGTGMAPNESGFYDALFINNEAHHYIYYENESDKRAKLITKEKEFLELEWQIKKAFLNETELELNDLANKKLFFVIFIDSNLDKVFDKDEIHMVEVQFK